MVESLSLVILSFNKKDSPADGGVFTNDDLPHMSPVVYRAEAKFPRAAG